jgi:hypothetical protein
MDTNHHWWAFDSAHRLLNEVIALGTRGQLSAWAAHGSTWQAGCHQNVGVQWARWFSDFVCAERFELADFLTSNVDIKSVTTDDPMVVLGWITNVVAPLVQRPTRTIGKSRLRGSPPEGLLCRYARCNH